WVVRFAPSIVSSRYRSGAAAGSSPANDSAAAFEATSPACAPPIPSATTNSGARVKKESSLALRWRPVSLRTASSAMRRLTRSPDLEAEDGVADLDRVAVDRLRFPVQRRAIQQGAVGRAHVLDE